MTATFAEAYGEILTKFKAAWDTTGFDALYPNLAGDPPTDPAPWARVSISHSPGSQTLGDDTTGRRYERYGLLLVQVFVPTGEGLPRALNLAKIITDAFEGATTPSGVWFRNVRVNEVGPDGSWYQVNVIAEFTYDEIK